MNKKLKTIITSSLLGISLLTLHSQEQKPELKIYGFVRNDFFYNSRQNEQSLDGVFHISPKPIIKDENGKDKNAIAEAEMISVSTRLGLDVKGPDMLGAKTFAKVEADFAGSGNMYFVLRLRQAYAKFNWRHSELLIGQTWHPLFGKVFPNIISLNTGSPIQAFNRSPQISYTYNLGDYFSISAAALYQMQYMSQGPEGTSANYMKRAILPNFFIGIENKTQNWTNGIGFDTKTIKPNPNASLTSISATIYTQYVDSKFQFRLKTLWGQNLSDHLMMNGYGVSKFDEITMKETEYTNFDEITMKETEYTNFDILTSWINLVYGKTWRIGLFAGYSQNLGSNKELAESATGNFAVYSRGFYQTEQLFADCLYRASLYLSYNLPKLSFGAEYNFTSIMYGNIQNNGRTTNNYWVDNHRIAASIIYTF
ncbi:hypothetical protein [Paludibacter sp. 221]|uniref:hypothetical protein n=1 Tax=Paludibacter sp. 221 TaxID=2302939 RepID=UPI0013D6D367|nr:hypothetical protein [Paludibacter sp. 221]